MILNIEHRLNENCPVHNDLLFASVLPSFQDGLSVCRSVSVLYLYDNQIREITGVSSCPLTHLYLQNNLITTVRGLGTLHRLTKLCVCVCVRVCVCVCVCERVCVCLCVCV